MTPYLQDTDFTLWVGDVRDVLAELEPGSVDCVITSPPYWGLRDYGTGEWDGGNPDCDHIAPGQGSKAQAAEMRERAERRGYNPGNAYANYGEGMTRSGDTYRDVCGKCGARRVDNQIGLEPTPDLFVQTMVDVFRQVRRVLAGHGTCWINLGDSYATTAPGTVVDPGAMTGKHVNEGPYRRPRTPPGIKPKDLCMIPARVALALQADGWWLRSDIIWSKPNPMPESVTDRPTSSYEHVFLLTKQPRYWFDAEAVREPSEASPESLARYAAGFREDYHTARDDLAGEVRPSNRFTGMRPSSRNVRNVWEIATQPYAGAHFATYPEELVRRCLLAGCPEWVCRRCGKPRERIVERGDLVQTSDTHIAPYTWSRPDARDREALDGQDRATARAIAGHIPGHQREIIAESWSDCGCEVLGEPSGLSGAFGNGGRAEGRNLGLADGSPNTNYRPGRVLDPFIGSGTTALVARRHGRHTIGVELNPEYARLCAQRLQQLSLLAELLA